MERPMVIKSINDGGLSQQVFTNVVIDPNLQYTSSNKATIRSRDASFSSYINLGEGKSTHQPQQPQDDSELSIFDAQKYFNETAGGGGDSKPNKIRVSPVESSLIGLDCIPERDSVPRFSSASSSVDGYSSYGRNYRTRSFHATPTASSEASWNSQTGLLTNPPGAVSVSVRNPSPDQKRKGPSAARRWLFGRRCPCYGRRSVRVDEKVSEPKTPSRLERAGNDNSDRIPWGNNINTNTNTNTNTISITTTAHQWAERKEAVSNCFPPPVSGLTPPHRVLSSSARPFGEGPTGFTFPILSQASSNSHKVALNKPPLVPDPPRESLEVFQPTPDPLQRRSFTFPASPKAGGRGEDDAASDASSDLFEIESFSTTTQSTSYPMYINNNNNTRRDSLDDAAVFNARRLNVAVGRPSVEEEPVTPSVAATECYEPSEVSIDWSVVTAEGFDRGSTITSYSVSASEANYRAIMRHREGEKAGPGEKLSKKGGGSGSGGLLTSCRCEKAVNVGPEPVRHVGMIAGNSYKPPLARSHSARLSLPFAT